jgi:transposase
MNAKKELKNVKDLIQELNDEHDSIVSRTKSSREELLKVNNDLKEKSVESEKSTDGHEKQRLIVQEVNNAKIELSKIKDEIKKYSKELESVRTKTDNSPDVKKMKEEREKLENEIIQKRKELESGFRELKFIKDEMAKSSKSEGSDKIVDAASAVVASMNQKLQTTLTELNAVKKALENERGQQKSSA